MRWKVEEGGWADVRRLLAAKGQSGALAPIFRAIPAH